LTCFQIGGDDIERSTSVIPYSSTTNKGGIKGYATKRHFVPKGLVLEIPVLHMHHDPQLWGENVMEFDPNRFAKGVSKACRHQQSFIPFSFGPRNCLGQNFSLMESKVVVASVLSRFQLSVSPSYKHCPHNPFVHSPKFGVQLIIKSLTPSPMS